MQNFSGVISRSVTTKKEAMTIQTDVEETDQGNWIRIMAGVDLILLVLNLQILLLQSFLDIYLKPEV